MIREQLTYISSKKVTSSSREKKKRKEMKRQEKTLLFNYLENKRGVISAHNFEGVVRLFNDFNRLDFLA